MKRTREDDSEVVTFIPEDALPRELWLNEIFLANIQLNGINNIWCLDTLAMAGVCQWFAALLEPYTTAFRRAQSHVHHFDAAVYWYLVNSTSTLNWLTHLKWHPPIVVYKDLYMQLAMACFARNTRDVFFTIVQRHRRVDIGWFTCARTVRDVQRFLALIQDGRTLVGVLCMHQLLSIVHEIDWAGGKETLDQLVLRLYHHVLEQGPIRDPDLTMADVVLLSRSIIRVYMTNKASAVVSLLNDAWEAWHGCNENRTQRHMRIKTIIELVLQENCPSLIPCFIYQWPPKSPNESLSLSLRERLNILISLPNLFRMTSVAPTSREWLLQHGYGRLFDQLQAAQ